MKMHIKRLIPLLSVSLAPFIFQTAQAAIAPNGNIAYTTCEYNSTIGDNTCDIWVMGPDGANPVNITNTPDVSELSPSWSGDGQKIAFTIDIGAGNANIWVMNADGSNQQQVTFKDQPDTYAWQGDPSFSPDGAKIAFTRHRPFSYMGDQTDIFVINVDGTGEMPITNMTEESIPFDEVEPAWSPDGSKIAFSGVRFEEYIDPLGVPSEGAQWEILTMNPDGSGEQILSAGAEGSERAQYLEQDRGPSWSPDGVSLLFSSESQIPACCNPWQNWLVNVDGSGLVNISPDPAISDGGAIWSPDGTQILFTRANEIGGTDLFVMPAPVAATLSAQTNLLAAAVAAPVQLTNAGNIMDAAWAPKTTNDVSKAALTITKDGNGRGLIKSAPNGIACGQICSADFNLNSLVTLTANAAKGSKFVRWGGACATVRGISCVVTMDAAKAASATFRRL
ncbi:MAG: TolB family protein [Methylococcaceae bacterium]